jgi:hypothetical protein
MAWIAPAPESPRHPKPRFQVRYQDGKRQRSAGIFHTAERLNASANASNGAFPNARVPRARATGQRQGPNAVRQLRHQGLVANLESAASRLGVQHRQAGREADPASLRQFAIRGLGLRPDRRMEGSTACRGAPTVDGKFLSELARLDPQRRGRQRLRAPLAADAQEPPAGSLPPRTCRCDGGRCGSPDPNSTRSPRRSTRATKPLSWWPRSLACAGESLRHCDGTTSAWTGH